MYYVMKQIPKYDGSKEFFVFAVRVKPFKSKASAIRLAKKVSGYVQLNGFIIFTPKLGEI